MTLKFDKNGLVIEAGNIRCFYYDAESKEYTGWSDEFINAGVSMPGNSTDIDPGDEVAGMAAVFSGDTWKWQEDHRGEIVYSTENGATNTVDYIGVIKDGFTSAAPASDYDSWNGSSWVTDTSAQHTAAVAAADRHAQQLIDTAMQSISVLQLKLQAGRTLTGVETTKLNAVLDYIDAVTAVDTSTAPDVSWPDLAV